MAIKLKCLFFTLCSLVICVILAVRIEVSIQLPGTEQLTMPWYRDYYKTSSGFYGQIVVDLNTEANQHVAEFEERIQALADVNPDVIGWIRSDGFALDYPVLYSEDNKKYLRTNLYGEYDVTGEIYLDANYDEQFSPVKLIHGHNMRNGTMFANLPQMLEWETLDDADLIEIYDFTGLKTYKIVSVYSVNSEEESVIVDQLTSLEDLKKLKDEYLERSWVPVSEVPRGIEMLMLNTCWYGPTGDQRHLHCIVVAVRV